MIEFKQSHSHLIIIKRDGESICDLYKRREDIWKLDEAMTERMNLDATELRQIADKLDELNNAK